MAWINLTFFAEEKDIELLSEALETEVHYPYLFKIKT